MSADEQKKTNTDVTETIKSLRDDFICPITQELMRDPVLTTAGIMYDRPAITRWLNSGHNTDPLAGTPLSVDQLITCYKNKQIIDRLYSDELNQTLNETTLQNSIDIFSEIQPFEWLFLPHLFCSLNGIDEEKAIVFIDVVIKEGGNKYQRYRWSKLSDDYQDLMPQFTLFKKNLFTCPKKLIKSLLAAALRHPKKVLDLLNIQFSSSDQKILFDWNELKNETVLEALCDIISTHKWISVNSILDIGKSIIYPNQILSVYYIAKIQPSSLRDLILEKSSDILAYLVDEDDNTNFSLVELLNVNTDVLTVLLADENSQYFSFVCTNLELSMQECINHTIPIQKQIALIKHCALINFAFRIESKSTIDEIYKEKFKRIASQYSGEDRVDRLIICCQQYQQSKKAQKKSYTSHQTQANTQYSHQRNVHYDVPYAYNTNNRSRLLQSPHRSQCCLHLTWKTILSMGCMSLGSGLAIYYGYKTGESLVSHASVNDSDALLCIIGALIFIIGVVIGCCFKTNQNAEMNSNSNHQSFSFSNNSTYAVI